jgi:type II secretory pathway component PulF
MMSPLLDVNPGVSFSRNSRLAYLNLLLKALANAVQLNVPFHEALEQTVVKRYPKVLRLLYVMGKGGLIIWKWPLLFVLLRPGRVTWNVCVDAACTKLKKGVPLATVLKKHFALYIPAHLILAIKKAENEGRLPELLPRLAAMRHRNGFLNALAREELRYPIALLVSTGSVVSGLFIFIVPKMVHMMTEMMPEGMPLPFMVACFLVPVGEFFRSSFFAILVGLGMLWMWPYSRRPGTGALLRFVPGFAGYYRQLALAELTEGLQCFTACGCDVVEAMRSCAEATNKRWLRKRILPAVEQISRGRSWSECLIQLKLGGGVENSLISSAALREDPSEGFANLTRWLDESLRQQAERLSRYLGTGMHLLVCFCIGTIAISFFNMLTEMIKVCL